MMRGTLVGRPGLRGMLGPAAFVLATFLLAGCTDPPDAGVLEWKDFQGTTQTPYGEAAVTLRIEWRPSAPQEDAQGNRWAATALHLTRTYRWPDAMRWDNVTEFVTMEHERIIRGTVATTIHTPEGTLTEAGAWVLNAPCPNRYDREAPQATVSCSGEHAITPGTEVATTKTWTWTRGDVWDLEVLGRPGKVFPVEIQEEGTWSKTHWYDALGCGLVAVDTPDAHLTLTASSCHNLRHATGADAGRTL